MTKVATAIPITMMITMPYSKGKSNVVTAVLASYRGFDTLGEVTVVFTGGIGVLVLLRRRWRADRTKGEK